jgi:hypothetical protein
MASRLLQLVAQRPHQRSVDRGVKRPSATLAVPFVVKLKGKREPIFFVSL